MSTLGPIVVVIMCYGTSSSGPASVGRRVRVGVRVRLSARVGVRVAVAVWLGVG